MDKRIVMVAPTGARRRREDHPALPITPEEIAACAEACTAAGASALHLHVRDDRQEHSLDPGRYRAAMAAVADRAPGLPIQCTTEAADIFGVAEQFAMVKALCPAWVSFSLVEMMRDGARAASEFLRWADEAGVRIQFILYSPEDIAEFASLHRAGGIPDERPQLIVVAGRYGRDDLSSLALFDALHASLRREGLAGAADWMACAFGREELACLERALELGGHVRVGFENAIVDHAGAPLRDNAQRVRQVCDIAKRLGIGVASPAEAGAQLRRA